MNIILKAKHFKGTEFCTGLCAIEKAIIEQYNVTPDDANGAEGVDEVLINGTDYEHKIYGVEDFDLDKEVAEEHGFDETEIRTIELI